MPICPFCFCDIFVINRVIINATVFLCALVFGGGIFFYHFRQAVKIYPFTFDFKMDGMDSEDLELSNDVSTIQIDQKLSEISNWVIMTSIKSAMAKKFSDLRQVAYCSQKCSANTDRDILQALRFVSRFQYTPTHIIKSLMLQEQVLEGPPNLPKFVEINSTADKQGRPAVSKRRMFGENGTRVQ